MSSFFALGENICRHRCAFNPLEARFVAGYALLEHAELNAEAFVFRRLACCGSSSEESICQALAIVLAQGFRLLEIGFILSKIAEVYTVHRTELGTCPYVPNQWRMLHTRLQGKFSLLVVSSSSSKPALRLWRTHRARCSDAPPSSRDQSWMIHQGDLPKLRPQP